MNNIDQDSFGGIAHPAFNVQSPLTTTVCCYDNPAKLND